MSTNLAQAASQVVGAANPFGVIRTWLSRASRSWSPRCAALAATTRCFRWTAAGCSCAAVRAGTRRLAGPRARVDRAPALLATRPVIA